jgi:hypothetical protein
MEKNNVLKSLRINGFKNFTTQALLLSFQARHVCACLDPV